MVHQNKKTNFGSSFYLSKTEGLGMASIRSANCMELRLVRAWHHAIACISSTPFVLDSIQCSALIPCSLKRGSMPQRVADSIHGFAVIKYESEADNYGKKELAFRVSSQLLEMIILWKQKILEQ